MMSFGKAVVLLATIVVSVKAQQLDYLVAPTQEWVASGAGGIFDNNGLYTAPDDSIVVSISSDCVVSAYDPMDGNLAWSTTFLPDGEGYRCFGGVTFNYDALDPYLVFSVVDNPLDVLNATTRVIALNTDGFELFSSVPLTGIAAGSPVTSFDGRHIYLTLHSAAKTVGHFSILDINRLVEDPTNFLDSLPLEPIFFATNETYAFSPPGIFHMPAEGYYDGGGDNQNDMLVWAVDTSENATEAGEGQMFGYQQPLNYNFDGVGLEILELGGARDWQAPTAPVLTNSGRSLYWSSSRASLRCWVGAEGETPHLFNRGQTNAAGLARGDPIFIGARASPALSSDTVEPMLYGPGASEQFYAVDSGLENLKNVTTDSLVYSPAKVSPDDAFVYYVTENAVLYQADAITLEQRWNYTVAVSSRVEGDIAMNSAGTMLYIGTTSGDVFGLEVATTGSFMPSAAPFFSSAPSTSSAPSSLSSSVPSSTPTTSAAPTLAPVAASELPSIAASFAPSSVASAAPSFASSDMPSTVPSPLSSSAPSSSPTSSAAPTNSPVDASESPSSAPSFAPSTMASAAPSFAASVMPSAAPTAAPSSVPSSSPTASAEPSTAPVIGTTAMPSAVPSAMPSLAPNTMSPTGAPTAMPSLAPNTMSPTGAPTSGAMSGAVASILALAFSVALFGL